MLNNINISNNFHERKRKYTAHKQKASVCWMNTKWPPFIKTKQKTHPKLGNWISRRVCIFWESRNAKLWICLSFVYTDVVIAIHRWIFFRFLPHFFWKAYNFFSITFQQLLSDHISVTCLKFFARHFDFFLFFDFIWVMRQGKTMFNDITWCGSDILAYQINFHHSIFHRSRFPYAIYVTFARPFHHWWNY